MPIIYILEEVEETSEADPWFLPGAIEEEPEVMPSGPRAQSWATALLDEWRKADAKTWHGLTSAVRAGPQNMRIQAFLTAAAVNLKRLAAALWLVLVRVLSIAVEGRAFDDADEPKRRRTTCYSREAA